MPSEHDPSFSGLIAGPQPDDPAARILESITDAFFALDRAWRFVYLNSQAERLLRRTRQELLGRNVWEEFPAATGAAFYREYHRAVDEQVTVAFEEYYPPPLDTWFEVRAYPSADGLAVYFHDISQRKALEAERERLREEAEARAEREALMNRIGEAIRASLDPDVVQKTAAAVLGEALGADRCFYIRYDRGRNVAELGQDWHRADLPSISGEYRLSDFDSLLNEMFPGGKTAVIEDLEAGLSPAHAGVMAAFHHRAVLAVPFFDDARIVAALFVSMADGPRCWTADQVQLVEKAAEQTRTAVETAQISQREHRIATELQEALLPRAPEQPPGLRVAAYTKPALAEAEVGGDFFDVFALDKELYALVVGDVSGKGLAAAAQLALVRNSLRTTLYLYRTPGQAVTNLNAILTTHDLLAGFVTAFAAIYDVSTGQVAYASCGHEPALIRRAATGAVETLTTTGPPLGVAENIVYGEGAVTLASGDALLVYTDGLSEAGPSRRQLLGTDGLVRLFAAQEPGEDVEAAYAQLEAAVNSYANGVFRDDVCMLLARRR